MNLSLQQTKHVSKLAKLNLSDEEVTRFQKQLSSILEYVELLNEVDTSRVKIAAQVSGLKDVYREDKPSKEEVLTQGEVLKNAPEKQDGYIKTAAVL